MGVEPLEEVVRGAGHAGSGDESAGWLDFSDRNFYHNSYLIYLTYDIFPYFSYETLYYNDSIEYAYSDIILAASRCGYFPGRVRTSIHVGRAHSWWPAWMPYPDLSSPVRRRRPNIQGQNG